MGRWPPNRDENPPQAQRSFTRLHWVFDRAADFSRPNVHCFDDGPTKVGCRQECLPHNELLKRESGFPGGAGVYQLYRMDALHFASIRKEKQTGLGKRPFPFE
jgi:hypothetical protein